MNFLVYQKYLEHLVGSSIVLSKKNQKNLEGYIIVYVDIHDRKPMDSSVSSLFYQWKLIHNDWSLVVLIIWLGCQYDH